MLSFQFFDSFEGHSGISCIFIHEKKNTVKEIIFWKEPPSKNCDIFSNLIYFCCKRALFDKS